MPQAELTDDGFGLPDTPADHLSREWPGDGFPGRRTASIRPGTDREYYCRTCLRRVTRATEAPVEYGHEPDCEHALGGARDE